MSQFEAPFRRVETNRGHGYRDARGHKIPGVTTILGEGVPKKALMDWGPRVTAEYAVDHWDELSSMSPSARVEKLKGARWEATDAAAKRGTEVHALAEKLIAGEEVEIPDAIAGHVESYVRFLDEFDPQPILIEAAVCSYKYGYSGTLDLIADFNPAVLARDVPEVAHFDRPVRAICDLKTSRSGIWGETALQLAAYRFADVYLDAGGAEQPMIPVDIALGIHVTADDSRLLPIPADQARYRQFQYVQQVALFCAQSRDLIGPPITPPSRVQRRRLEIVSQEATA
jgi:hypothetical protein